MARKKNRSEPAESDPLSEPAAPAPEGQAPQEESPPSSPAALPPEVALEPIAPTVEALPKVGPELPSLAMGPPAPVVPAASPAETVLSHYELELGESPVAHPAAPVAVVAPAVPLAPLEERIRNLEQLLTQLQHLKALEQTVVLRPAEQAQPPAPPASSGPSVFGQVGTLIEASRHLLPNLPPGIAPPPMRRWLLWEIIAELRAMVYMYVDPRYRLSWYGYVLPPVLFLAYLSSYYWVPFTGLLEAMKLSRALTVPVDLLLLYTMFKILGSEARRYRETAPDLPPSLRL